MFGSNLSQLGGIYGGYNYGNNLTSSIDAAVKKALGNQAITTKPAMDSVNTAPSMEDFIKTLPSMQQNARMYANNPMQNAGQNPAELLRQSYTFMGGQGAPSLSGAMQQQGSPMGGAPAPQPMQQNDVRAKLAQLLGG